MLVTLWQEASASYYLGGCQNYGPFLGTLNIRCRIILGIPKGTIILTTTHLVLFWAYPWLVLAIWGFPIIMDTFLGGSYNKDCSVLGSILGSPYFGKLPYLLKEPPGLSHSIYRLVAQDGASAHNSSSH